MVNRSIQFFVTLIYGHDAWSEIAMALPSGRADYNALESYPDAETRDLITVAAHCLGKSAEVLLEDLGTWLVTGDERPVRRLLRFGGTDFLEFLYSLDDLPGRARLAVNDLALPSMELCEHAPCCFTLTLGTGMDGVGPIALGLLRAMADDYGALALMDLTGGGGANEVVQIRLVQTDYTQGRAFALTAGPT